MYKKDMLRRLETIGKKHRSSLEQIFHRTHSLAAFGRVKIIAVSHLFCLDSILIEK